MNRIQNHEKTARAPREPGDYPLQAPEDGFQLTRKERETRRHRRELLEASENLLATKRFHEITVQDIAMESEFSVGYIYKLFPNKDEIFAALIHHRLGELRSLLDESLGPYGTWEKQALDMLAALFDWLDETPAYRLGVIPDLQLFARTNPRVAADLAGFRDFFRGRIDAMFADALRLGHLREDEPGMIARTFRALASGFTDDKLLEQPSDESLRIHAPLIVRVIRGAFAPKGGDR